MAAMLVAVVVVVHRYNADGSDCCGVGSVAGVGGGGDVGCVGVFSNCGGG